MSNKTASWKGNFRRWSTQVFAAMGVVSIAQLLPYVVETMGVVLPIWKPILSAEAHAVLQSVLAGLGIILRNIKQGGDDDTV